MQQIKKLFGPRVAVELIEEEYEGLIVPAPTNNKMHMLSKVVSVGDKAKYLKTGDIVLWQWNMMIEHLNKYSINGKPVFILMELDMVARLTSPKVTLEHFQVVGEWCLISRVVEKTGSKIILPDNVAEATPALLHYFLEQKGEAVGDELATVGDEVIVDRTKANPLRIGDANFFYIQKPFVIGTMDGFTRPPNQSTQESGAVLAGAPGSEVPVDVAGEQGS